MSGMERVHPKVPAQREAAQWWLAEVRADLERISRTRSGQLRAREVVIEHAGRISPTVLASAAMMLGVSERADFDDRNAMGLLARITNVLVRPFRDL